MTEIKPSQLRHRVDELAAQTARCAARIEQERELPVELVTALAEAGIFRLLVPQSLGGAELALPEYIELVEQFARADASTAWCINQAAVAATNAGKTPIDLAEKIWGDPRGATANGPLAEQTATPCDGGFLLNGRWNFASGCLHATWIMAFAREIEPNPESFATDRRPVPRQFFIPQDEVTFIDAWQVNGLRGTGSMSFEFNDKFVPLAHCGAYFNNRPHESGPLYKIATHLLFAAGFAATALGTARAGLDDTIALTRHKKPGLDPVTLRDKHTVQRQIGQAEATWQGARAYLRQAVLQLWQGLDETDTRPTLEDRVQLRLATTHAIRMATEVITIAYQISGSTAIFSQAPIQRRFQDLNAITQQIQGRMEHYDTAGRYFLGIEDDLPNL